MTKQFKIVALVCERSVDFEGALDDTGCLKSNASVAVIQVPCSGQIQPSMIDTAFKKGAAGVITTGCRIGDCHYREGNKFLLARILGERQPKVRLDEARKKRLRPLWLSAVELNIFQEEADMLAASIQLAE
jgi:F420-non-reducing hydrogenase iron-sulfur subunit